LATTNHNDLNTERRTQPIFHVIFYIVVSPRSNQFLLAKVMDKIIPLDAQICILLQASLIIAEKRRKCWKTIPWLNSLVV